jgi:GTP-binding protein Era
VQTTRFQVRGVAIHGAAQIVLVDTPGVFAPRRRLDRAMVRAAWAGAADADVIVHVVDAAAEDRGSRKGAETKPADVHAIEDTEKVVEGLLASNRRAILALNKIDLLARDHLLALAQRFSARGVYDDVVMIAAERGDGVERLADLLAAAMPEGPWLYPEDQIADLPQRLLAAEITREKAFLRLHDEIPYACTVETESWKAFRDGGVRIEQTLYVARESQRKIALGKDGQTIKAISKSARLELEEMLERPVHLFLFVKVREDWMDDRARYDALGLEWEG